MAWNEPTGQPPKDPWGPRKPQQGPPDLEEIINNASKKLRSLFGGKKTGGNDPKEPGTSTSPAGILIGVAVVVVVWAIFSSVHIVDARERGVVLTFGKVTRTLEPGLNLTFPPPIQRVQRVDVTNIRSMDAQVRMLTRDENMVEVNFAVQYTINEPEDFLFAVSEPEIVLSQTAEAAIRQIMGSRTLDDILVGNRSEISIQARDLLEKLLNEYRAGIAVSSVNLQEATVPDQVKDAFDDAIKAREDEQRIANEARAYESEIVPVARGNASRIMQEAEAYRDSLIAKATGEADRFRALVAEYRVAPEVTRKRLYLETMQEVLSKTPKVLIDKDAGNNVMYLPLDRMMQPGAAPVTPQANNGGTR